MVLLDALFKPELLTSEHLEIPPAEVTTLAAASLPVNSILQEQLRQEAELKWNKIATKVDDAEVPVHLWNDRIACPLKKGRQRTACLI